MALFTNLFVIRKSKPGSLTSGLTPNIAVPMGTALKFGNKDVDTGENTFTYANGWADGFITRDIRQSTGLTDAELVDQLMGLPLLETPFEATKAGSIEFATQIECEGTDFILTSGTGAITTGTAVASKLSFLNGKFRVAQAADFAQFRLVQQMTPNVAGNVRIFVEAIDGYLVP